MNEFNNEPESEKIIMNEKLSTDFDNWFTSLTFKKIYNQTWYTKEEKIVIEHLCKKNIKTSKELEWRVVKNEYNNFYHEEYVNMYCSASINHLDYYTDLLNLINIEHKGCTNIKFCAEKNDKPSDVHVKCYNLITKYNDNMNNVVLELFPDINFDNNVPNDMTFREKLFDTMKRMPTFKAVCKEKYMEDTIYSKSNNPYNANIESKQLNNLNSNGVASGANNQINFDSSLKHQITISSVSSVNQRKKSSFFTNHIGKTIFFGLISVGVGFLFGWIYALIPIIALIVLAILDYKYEFKLLPGPKKILSCVMPCLSCLKEVEEEKNPEGDKSKIKDIEI